MIGLLLPQSDNGCVTSTGYQIDNMAALRFSPWVTRGTAQKKKKKVRMDPKNISPLDNTKITLAILDSGVLSHSLMRQHQLAI